MSRWRHINTGTSTCRTSTLAERSTTCAAFWTAAALHCELGSPGVDDRGGHRSHYGAREGTSPGGEAPDHLRQRAAVHRQGLQGVHSDLGHDPRQNFALLSPIERK